MRLTLRVAGAVRKVVPSDLPVFVRISGTDWANGGWDIDQLIYICSQGPQLLPGGAQKRVNRGVGRRITLANRLPPSRI